MRQAIVKQMEAKGWTAYRLAKEVRGKMTAQTVYDYIGDRTRINDEFLGYLMTALGLEIRPKG